MVYDIFGKLVKTFTTVATKTNKEKIKNIAWDERDNFGILLPAGVYFCKLESNSKNVEKIIIIK